MFLRGRIQEESFGNSTLASREQGEAITPLLLKSRTRSLFSAQPAAPTADIPLDVGPGKEKSLGHHEPFTNKPAPTRQKLTPSPTIPSSQKGAPKFASTETGVTTLPSNNTVLTIVPTSVPPVLTVWPKSTLALDLQVNAPHTNTTTSAPIVPNKETTGTQSPKEPATNALSKHPTKGGNQKGQSGGGGGAAAGVDQPVATTAPNNLPTDKPLISSNKNASPSCNTLSCQGFGVLNQHPLLYVAIFMVLTFFCCLRCKLCGGRRVRDPRGEYRAVGRMLAHNFDTDLTDEDMNFYASDEEDNLGNDSSNNNDNNGWSNRNKGSIELGSIGDDGLTLEEMNG